tara:strand:- start:136 stop:372 length:237 start_codon:yes stop_codon:yes gene_type:complete
MSRFSTPLDKQVAEIVRARKRFVVVAVFNDLVKDLVETDKEIQNMPEGNEKEVLLESQKEAWDLLLSEQMCGTIVVEA